MDFPLDYKVRYYLTFDQRLCRKVLIFSFSFKWMLEVFLLWGYKKCTIWHTHTGGSWRRRPSVRWCWDRGRPQPGWTQRSYWDSSSPSRWGRTRCWWRWGRIPPFLQEKRVTLFRVQHCLGSCFASSSICLLSNCSNNPLGLFFVFLFTSFTPLRVESLCSSSSNLFWTVSFSAQYKQKPNSSLLFFIWLTFFYSRFVNYFLILAENKIWQNCQELSNSLEKTSKQQQNIKAQRKYSLQLNIKAQWL